jgi:hypothetical protein
MGMPEDLRTHLIANGITSSIFIAEAPEKPDQCAVITQTGGTGPTRTHSGTLANAPVTHLRAQLRVRGLTYAAADTLMTSIYALLSGLQNQVINGAMYYYGIPVQTPYYLGLDGASRPVIAVNYDVWRNET